MYLLGLITRCGLAGRAFPASSGFHTAPSRHRESDSWSPGSGGATVFCYEWPRLADRPHPGHPDQGPCILVLDLRVRHVEPGHRVSAGVDSGPFGPALLDDGRRRFAAAVWVGSPSRAGPLVRGAAVPNPDPPNHALCLRRHRPDASGAARAPSGVPDRDRRADRQLRPGRAAPRVGVCRSDSAGSGGSRIPARRD